MDEHEWFRCQCGIMIKEVAKHIYEEQGGTEHECDFSEDVKGTGEDVE